MAHYKADAITSFRGEYAYLSNFFTTMVPYENAFYPSAEHAYQAAKTKDLALRKMIRDCGKASEAKHLGKTLPLRPAWELIKFKVMKRIVKAKFATNYKLAVWLAWTEGRELVEGNDHGDRIWGSVWNALRAEWEGDNRLGKILVEVREEQFRPAV